MTNDVEQFASAVSPHPSVREQLRRRDKPLRLATSRNALKQIRDRPAFRNTTLKIIVLLIEFPDQAFQQTADHYRQLIFSQREVSTGSVREYYHEVSAGAVDLQGEVAGPFQVLKSQAFYAAGNFGLNTLGPNSSMMAGHAIAATGGQVNFHKYDNNGDLIVEGVIIIHAGTGGEASGSADDLWSQTNTIGGAPIPVDGVALLQFCTVPEDLRIGVLCHEMGHLLFGLPDLYDTDQSSNGVGDWCLMGSGNWLNNGDTPAHLSAWCKASLGWIDVAQALFAVLEQADPALVDPGVTAQMERLLDDVLIGQQDLIGAIDAVCVQASRIIGRLRESAERAGQLGGTVGGEDADRPSTHIRKRFVNSVARKQGLQPPQGYATSSTARGVILDRHAPSGHVTQAGTNGNQAPADIGAKPQTRPRKRFVKGHAPAKVHPDMGSRIPTRKATTRKRKVGSGKSAVRSAGKVNEDARPADAPGGDTPLRIPFGNKEVAFQLGARYRAGGWYAPLGIDLDGFRQRGWL